VLKWKCPEIFILSFMHQKNSPQSSKAVHQICP
jgi:hypothetical protein